MDTDHPIVAALDGSWPSEQALPVATYLAQGLGVPLVLVRAAPRPGTASRAAPQPAVAEAQVYLAALACRLARRGVRAEVAVPWDTPAAGILAEVERWQAGLVVMSTHGRSGVGRWLHGSVAETVLAGSPVPVVLVPPAGPLEECAPPPVHPHLLVPLDGSAFSEASLPPATELAHALQATVVLLQVIVPLTAESALARPDVLEAYSRNQIATATGYLAGIAAGLQQQGVEVETRVRVGMDAGTILAESEALGAALLVMATHGRTGLARMLLGSVAMSVIRHGRVPVLLIRPERLVDRTEIGAFEAAADPAEAARERAE